MSRSQGAVLATERLRFHPWEADDLPLLLDLHRDPDVQRFLEVGGVVWDEEVFRTKFERFRADDAENGWTKFKLLDAQGRFLGRAGFSRVEQTGALELGYSLKREFWGQGYAGEAAKALLNWIYRAAPVDHVIGFAFVEHTASRRVLEKAGMSFTGVQNLDGTPHAFYRHNRPS